MAHDVFISYSSKDKLVADAVCATLEAAKIRCWITPRDILPGQDWAESIEDAITKSKLLVLIFSSYSNNSKQVSREISLAFNSEVTVIPFRIEDIEPKGAMKYYLSNTHWQDALTPPIENHIKKLVEIVSTFIGRKIDDTEEVDKISSDQSKKLTEQQLYEYEKPEYGTGKVLTSQEKKPQDLEIKKGFIKKQNKKKLAIIFGVIGVIIIAAVITVLIKFPINKPEKLVETTTAEITTASENTANETSTAETTSEVETTSLQNESGQSAFSKIAFTSNRDGNFDIYIMDYDGSNQKRLTFDAGDPFISPDGSKLAFTSSRGGNAEICIMDSDGSNQKYLTNNESKDHVPCFSPDGSKIAFTSNRDGNFDIYIMDSDGSNQKNLTNNKSEDYTPCFFPDGSKISFTSDREGNADICIMDSDGSNQQNLTSNFGATDPFISPDGSKIAFTSKHAEKYEIYIMNIDGTNQEMLTDIDDYDPCFSTDGSKIVFVSGRDGNSEIYIMNIDGSNQQNLTNNESVDFFYQVKPTLE